MNVTMLGDTLLSVCLLMGCDEEMVKAEMLKEDIAITGGFCLAEMFYSKIKLRKISAKLGVSIELLNQVAMVLNNPFCCLLTDKTGNILRQLPDIIVLLTDKEHCYETVRIPF